jgi:cell division protein FtsB
MMRPMSRRRRRKAVSRAGIVRSLSRWARPLLSLAILTAGLLLSGAFVGVAVQQSAVAREAHTYQQDIVAEQARQERLRAEVAQRKTDPYVIDKARDLGYVRPGEGLIEVERASGPQAVAATTAGATERIARWLALFFGAR